MERWGVTERVWCGTVYSDWVRYNAAVRICGVELFVRTGSV